MIRKIGLSLLLFGVMSLIEAKEEKVFFPSGVMKSIVHYKDGSSTATSKGIKHGSEEVYYVNGKLAYKVNYINGKRDGFLRWHETDGHLIKETHFKMGKQHGWEKVYFPNGTLQHSVKFVNDKREGYLKEYYDTAVLANSVKFVKGKREGPYKRYHDNGKLMSEVLYVHNFKEGQEKWYDRHGGLVKKERHKMDRPVDVMKKVQAKRPDVTRQVFKGLNFNPHEVEKR